MTILKVTWTDAQTVNVGLEDIEVLRKEGLPPAICETVGFLINEDDKSLMLAQELWNSENKVKYIHLIPKSLVIKRRVLR